MAAKNLGKARNLDLNGVDGVSVPSPLYDISKIVFNNSGTLTVLVDFYQDQAHVDANDSFHTESYQVTQPAALDSLIDTELKTLPDFDAA